MLLGLYIVFVGWSLGGGYNLSMVDHKKLQLDKVGNTWAKTKSETSSDYSWLKEVVGSVKFKGKKAVSMSERVDDIYYDK